jgi:type III secretion protein L
MAATIHRAMAHLPSGPGARIIRPTEFAAWSDGFRFVKEAGAAADRIVEAARRAYDAEQARGYAEGRAAGATEAARLIADARGAIDEYLESIEFQVAELALDVVRRVLGQIELGELVARAAQEAATDFHRARFLKITVHPDAADQVRSAFAARDVTVVVEADPHLARTACIIASEILVIDAGIDAQLAAIAEAFARLPRGGA